MATSGGVSDIVSRKGTPSSHEPVEDLEQRDVGLGDRLEEPVLLEEVVVLGMAHEGQVRVQDEREVAGDGH